MFVWILLTVEPIREDTTTLTREIEEEKKRTDPIYRRKQILW